MTLQEAFTTFPQLTTERLTLRQISLDDVPACFAIRSIPAVTLPYAREPYQSPDQAKKWILSLDGYYQQQSAIMWCINRTGDNTMIGGVTLWNFDTESLCAELGYELHPDHQKQGLMSEAVTAVLDCGFNYIGLNRIEACPLAENATSNTLLTRLGFTYEGNLRQRIGFRGEYFDQLYYGLLKTDWQKHRLTE